MVKKKVLALPFELLNFSPQIFIKEISNFLNTNINLEQVKFEKLNESSQAGFFELERRINVLYKSDPIIDLFKKIIEVIFLLIL